MHRRKVQVVVAIAVLVFAGGIALSGDTVQSSWLRFFGAAVFVAVIALGAWERYLWRLPVVQRFKGSPIDVGGTWKGTLKSMWVDPDGKNPEPKDVYLVVRQTASTVHVSLLTDESKSHSSLGEVNSGNHGDRLDYLFVNSPAPQHEDRSRMHRGATTLDIVGRPATALEGRYWTDRDSRGELKFDRRIGTLAGSFTEAESLLEE